MANLRVIKKDIVFLVNEVISDCWVYLQLNPECDQAPVEQIIADAHAEQTVALWHIGDTAACSGNRKLVGS